MSKKLNWIAISYSVPPIPSKNRVYVWRKLKEYGAEYLNQSVALLPYTKNNLVKFKNLREKILSMEGSAAIFSLDFIDAPDEEDFIIKFKNQTQKEYMSLISECSGVIKNLKNKSQHTKELASKIKEIDKNYRKTKERQFFPEELSKELESGLREIKNNLKESAEDFQKELKNLLE